MDVPLTNDELLTTTRAVRRRLDLTRPVEPEVLLECLALALQAPTASNRQSWQWLFITEPATKAALAELYRAPADVDVRLPFEETGPGDVRSERAEAVGALGRLPVRAPGRGAGAAGALPPGPGRRGAGGHPGRPVGLAPAGRVEPVPGPAHPRPGRRRWTSIHLRHEREAAELLGIPYDRYTQGGLFPIAYTVGTDFAPAARRPLDQVVRWERW